MFAQYQAWSDEALAALAPLQDPPLADTVIALGNLGSHPLHLLANAFVVDHYCHLRHDVLQPGGPIARPPLPADDTRLRPTLEWMLGGLPQMCAAGLATMDRPLVLVFEGPAASSWVIRPAVDDGFVTVVEGTDGDAMATVTTSAHDFVQWGTQRRDWRTLDVRVDGDAAYAAAVLDVFNVI